MRFVIQVACGGEVVFAGQPPKTVYYGAPPETGEWRLSTHKFQNFIASRLRDLSFGDAVEEFRFGFEIADLDGWGDYFKKLADYISYRRSIKTLISVGQVEWLEVKDLSAEEQFVYLCKALDQAVSRIESMNRKPRAFDYQAFSEAITECVSECTLGAVIADA